MTPFDASTKVISFKIPVSEYKKLQKLAKKTGVRIGPIARGLMRRALVEEPPNDLIALIKLGSLFSRK